MISKTNFLLLIVFFIASLSSNKASSQSKFTYGIGFGVNASKIFLSGGDQPYPDPWGINLGVNIPRVFVEYNLGNRVVVNLQGGLSVMDSKTTINFKSSHRDLIFSSRYLVNKNLSFGIGVMYQKLTSFRIIRDIDLISLTSNEHFINPYITFNYRFNELISMNIEMAYTPRELLKTTTPDYNGIQVFGISGRRHFIGFNVFLKPFIFNKSKSKKRVR